MFLFFKKSDKINFEKDAVKSPGIKNFFYKKLRNILTLTFTKTFVLDFT